MKILVIDNYDSFVYNLVYMLKSFSKIEVDVVKNNQIEIDDVNRYDKILLSPGPGIPKDAGIMMQLIATYASTKSILGVCLGHQAIAEVFGASLYNLPEPLHGIASTIKIVQQDDLFNNIPTSITVGHYHSWVVRNTEDTAIEILAEDQHQNIMALRHKTFDVKGVQFHPESILTEYGYQIIKNWIEN
jgi:anthranilate synthase component II